MSLDLITSAAIGTLGWVGILARNYYTQITNLRIKEAEQNQANEQRRIEKQEGYFERLFQLFTMMVGEEKDERIAFQHEMTRLISELTNCSRSMSGDMGALSFEITKIGKRLENACSDTAKQ